MNNIPEENLGDFNIKGFITGFCVGTFIGIITLIFTKNFVISIAAGSAISITLGIILEQNFKNISHNTNKKLLKIFFAGILVLLAILFVLYINNKPNHFTDSQYSKSETLNKTLIKP